MCIYIYTHQFVSSSYPDYMPTTHPYHTIPYYNYIPMISQIPWICFCFFLGWLSGIKTQLWGQVRAFFSVCPLSSYCMSISPLFIWRFPEIGVPPNHPFIDGFSSMNHPFWGSPIYGSPQTPSFVILHHVFLNPQQVLMGKVGGCPSNSWPLFFYNSILWVGEFHGPTPNKPTWRFLKMGDPKKQGCQSQYGWNWSNDLDDLGYPHFRNPPFLDFWTNKWPCTQQDFIRLHLHSEVFDFLGVIVDGSTLNSCVCTIFLMLVCDTILPAFADQQFHSLWCEMHVLYGAKRMLCNYTRYDIVLCPQCWHVISCIPPCLLLTLPLYLIGDRIVHFCYLLFPSTVYSLFISFDECVVDEQSQSFDKMVRLISLDICCFVSTSYSDHATFRTRKSWFAWDQKLTPIANS